MQRRKRISRPHLKEKSVKEIRYFADYQIRWQSVIPELKGYQLAKVDFLSIPGDAPKDFTKDSEYRAGRRTRRQRVERYI